jgi:prepilin-type N-terminal cleavage/methylation domain-containing protein
MIFQKAKNKKQKANLGFTLVEVLVACSIITVVVLATMSAVQKSLQLSNLVLRQTQANFLLEEGAEAVRSIRDTSWTTISNLTLNTDYYLSYDLNLNSWSLSFTPNTIDSFTRKVIFESVSRDSNDDIASSGTLDTGTKKATITVSWPSTISGITSKSLSFYLADILN